MLFKTLHNYYSLSRFNSHHNLSSWLDPVSYILSLVFTNLHFSEGTREGKSWHFVQVVFTLWATLLPTVNLSKLYPFIDILNFILFKGHSCFSFLTPHYLFKVEPITLLCPLPCTISQNQLHFIVIYALMCAYKCTYSSFIFIVNSEN